MSQIFHVTQRYRMPWIESDGGRFRAGYQGVEGDCVVRAVCNITALPYAPVYQRFSQINANADPYKLHCSPRERAFVAMAICGKANCANGVIVDLQESQAYLQELGFVKETYFRAELTEWSIKSGRWLVRLYMHMTASIDGILVDSFDPQKDRDTWRYGVGEAWRYQPG